LYVALELGGFPHWSDLSGAVDTSHGLVFLPDKDKNSVLRPEAIAKGEDGGVWVAATFPASDSPTAAFLYRISTAATISARYRLPNNSQPAGIVWGPDDALWYTDLGNNRIGRITTGGRNTEYAIPTRNSGPKRITVGGDGALWFTETAANKIGRITTTGRISEYAVPTRNSGPTYIAGPYRAEGAPCCLNRTIWFSESNANKIAELHF
jgi:virginiamycin B lyase